MGNLAKLRKNEWMTELLIVNYLIIQDNTIWFTECVH